MAVLVKNNVTETIQFLFNIPVDRPVNSLMSRSDSLCVTLASKESDTETETNKEFGRVSVWGSLGHESAIFLKLFRDDFSILWLKLCSPNTT